VGEAQRVEREGGGLGAGMAPSDGGHALVVSTAVPLHGAGTAVPRT